MRPLPYRHLSQSVLLALLNLLVPAILIWGILLVGAAVSSQTSLDSGSEFAFAGCNMAKIVRLEQLLSTPPAKPSNLQTSLEVFPNAVGLRFVNPAGVTFDGVLALNQHLLLENLIFSPSPPVADSTWFEGHSWRPMFAKCGERESEMPFSSLIGWAFYKHGIFIVDKQPSFVFLILRHSLEDHTNDRIRAICESSGETDIGVCSMIGAIATESLGPVLLGQRQPNITPKYGGSHTNRTRASTKTYSA